MAYLVTGGVGFIGSRVVRDLVREGEKVVVYDWYPDRRPLERLLGEDAVGEKVKIVQGDVTDYATLVRTIKENDISRIVHLAAMMLLEVNANPLLGVRVDCEGTVGVFEAARFLGVEKVVWASSGSVYGPADRYPEEYIPADAPHFPQNIYGAAKSFDESVASYYTGRYGLDITAVRLVLVYGAGQLRGRTAAIMREMVYKPALGQPGRVPAAGENVLGWTYVDDAARALVLAAKSPPTKTKAFSVMGRLHSVQELADTVKGLLPGADITLLALEKSKSHTIMTCKYDMSCIREELGFAPQWTMPDGIRETINEVRREHGLEPL